MKFNLLYNLLLIYIYLSKPLGDKIKNKKNLGLIQFLLILINYAFLVLVARTLATYARLKKSFS